jgi:hypothetical protein
VAGADDSCGHDEFVAGFFLAIRILHPSRSRADFRTATRDARPFGSVVPRPRAGRRSRCDRGGGPIEFLRCTTVLPYPGANLSRIVPGSLRKRPMHIDPRVVTFREASGVWAIRRPRNPQSVRHGRERVVGSGQLRVQTVDADVTDVVGSGVWDCPRRRSERPRPN